MDNTGPNSQIDSSWTVFCLKILHLIKPIVVEFLSHIIICMANSGFFSQYPFGHKGHSGVTHQAQKVLHEYCKIEPFSLWIWTCSGYQGETIHVFIANGSLMNSEAWQTACFDL